MFGTAGALWGNFASSENLLEKERDPPPRPTRLEFPDYTPPECSHDLTNRHSASLRQSILGLRRPSEVPDSLLEHLNVKLEQDVPVSEFVPADQFPSRPYLYDNDLEAMLKELSIENDDAFRLVLKQGFQEGRDRVKMVYSRPFFTCLEDMARYWDASGDQYYEVDVDDEKSEKSAANGNAPKSDRDGDAKMIGFNDGSDLVGQQVQSQKIEKPASPSKKQKKEVYKGQRISNGEQMPPGLRTSAVRNLLKMVIYKFGCRDFDVSPRERLRIRNFNLPMVQCNFAVIKTPSDMKLARARFVEGPIMTVYTRPDVRFKLTEKDMETAKEKRKDSLKEPNITVPAAKPGRPPPASSSNTNTSPEVFGEKFDLCRELGCLLQLGIQRNRQGRSRESEMSKILSSQWWTTNPRWGNGPTHWGQMAHEIYEDQDPSWSPVERKLQAEKKEREEQEKKKLKERELEQNALMLDAEVDLCIAQPTNGGPMTERPKKKKRSGSHHHLFDDRQQDNNGEQGRKILQIASGKKRWFADWAKLRPNTFIWDEKIIWKKIGIPDHVDSSNGSQPAFEYLYLISSLNHHVCLMRMKVSRSYLEWLEFDNECMVKEAKAEDKGTGENILSVIRSDWFDLFSVEDRKTFLTLLWRVMSWVLREE